MRPAQHREPQNNIKFKVALNVVNNFISRKCVSVVKFRIFGDNKTKFQKNCNKRAMAIRESCSSAERPRLIL